MHCQYCPVPELSKSSHSSKPNMNFINVGFVVMQLMAPQGWPQVLFPPFSEAFGLSAPTAKDPRALVFHLLSPPHVRAVPLVWPTFTSR